MERLAHARRPREARSRLRATRGRAPIKLTNSSSDLTPSESPDLLLVNNAEQERAGQNKLSQRPCVLPKLRGQRNRARMTDHNHPPNRTAAIESVRTATDFPCHTW